MRDSGGVVWASRDAGARWEQVGQVAGVAADFEVIDATAADLALDDGTILRSRDGGRAWGPAFRP